MKFDLKINRILLLLLVLALLFTSACGKAEEPEPVAVDPAPVIEDPVEEPEPEPEPPKPVTAAFKLRFCGDLMTHQTQITNAKQSDGTYSFAEYFDEVKPLIEEADYAVVNFETTTPCTGKYSGYPSFRAPESIAVDIKNAGFDAVTTSNNHMNDSGLKGAMATLDVLSKAGLDYAGSRHSDQESRTTVVNIPITDDDGNEQLIAMALVSYTYETGILQGNRSINGVQIGEDQLLCYNTFQSYSGEDALVGSLNEIKAQIEYARGVSDLVVVYLHWGEEYQHKGNSQQQFIAHWLAENCKPDALVGSHSHTTENVEVIDGMPVYYSLGNFVSNQRQESLDNRYTEETIIADLTFSMRKETPDSAWSFEGVEAKAIPCWVDRYDDNGKRTYKIIPLTEGFENSPALGISGHTARARKGLEDIIGIVGEEYLIR